MQLSQSILNGDAKWPLAAEEKNIKTTEKNINLFFLGIKENVKTGNFKIYFESLHLKEALELSFRYIYIYMCIYC